MLFDLLASARSLPPGVDQSSVLRTLFGAYPDGLIVADAQGSVVLATQPVGRPRVAAGHRVSSRHSLSRIKDLALRIASLA